jgi:Arc/MetJ-type ribon-helix-helix transcriptional regulator
MTEIALSPEMRRFAEALVAAGKHASVADAADAALREMRARAKAELIASLQDAARESDEHGWLELDEVLAAMDDAIAEAERKRGAA